MAGQPRNIQTVALAGRKILVADDEQGVTLLVGEVLAGSGADVTRVHDGPEAIREIRHQRFDLVLLDLIMPRLNGWAVLEFIQEQYPQMMARTVLMTGDQYHVETVQRIHNMRMPSIFKPFDLDDLRAVVSETILFAEEICSLSAA